MHTLRVLNDLTIIFMWIGITVALAMSFLVFLVIWQDRKDQREKRGHRERGRHHKSRTEPWWLGRIGTVALLGVGPGAALLTPL